MGESVKSDIEKSNDKLMEELKKREDYWNNTIKELSNKLKLEAKYVVDLQADSISQRQILSDEIKYMTYELFKFLPIIKNIRKAKLEFYLIKYQIKLQGSDRLKMIESDLSYYDQRKDIYDNHIDFLKESLKNIDQINYGIKNKISLYELTGLD